VLDALWFVIVLLMLAFASAGALKTVSFGGDKWERLTCAGQEPADRL
jgi:hypothetical protein